MAHLPTRGHIGWGISHRPTTKRLRHVLKCVKIFKILPPAARECTVASIHDLGADKFFPKINPIPNPNPNPLRHSVQKQYESPTQTLRGKAHRDRDVILILQRVCQRFPKIDITRSIS